MLWRAKSSARSYPCSDPGSQLVHVPREAGWMGSRSNKVQHRHGLPSRLGLVSRPPGSVRCSHCQWLAQIDHAEWNHIVRGETELQSVDRHFNELLQELRVAHTGVQQGIYLVTLVLSAVSAALLIAPVGYHRTVFRQRLRPQLVTTGHRYAIAGLVLLLLALVGAVQLAASFVLGPRATILAAALAGLFATFWFVVPLVHRVRHQHRPTQQDPDPPVTD